MPGPWRSMALCRSRTTGGMEAWACAGVRPAPVEAAISGPMGSRTSICSKSTDSDFQCRISFPASGRPESLSVTWYESISGEEFSSLPPGRRPAVSRASSAGGSPTGRSIHRRVPIVSIGIAIHSGLLSGLPPPPVFGGVSKPVGILSISLDQTDHFPEMVRLLKEVRDYRGEGLAAKLFYDGKVAEAVALVVERHRAHPAPRRTLTQEDERMLADVAGLHHRPLRGPAASGAPGPHRLHGRRPS